MSEHRAVYRSSRDLGREWLEAQQLAGFQVGQHVEVEGKGQGVIVEVVRQGALRDWGFFMVALGGGIGNVVRVSPEQCKAVL